MPFFGTSWDVGVLNSAIFNIFHNRVEFGTILKGLRNFGVGGVEPPPPRYATVAVWMCYRSFDVDVLFHGVFFNKTRL